MLNTLRYIHANPKAAGVRKGFYDPYSNYGHNARLEVDGISEWHPSFLQLASTLKGCSKRYERFCQRYRQGNSNCLLLLMRGSTKSPTSGIRLL